MNCRKCGAELNINAEFCPECNAPVTVPKERKLKNRKISAALGMIFGIVGLPLFFSVIFSCLAVIFSALGIKSSNKNLAKCGLILGVVELLVCVILYIALFATSNVRGVADYIYFTFFA